MLRAVSTICVESRCLELLSAARRENFCSIRRSLWSTAVLAAQQTVLSVDKKKPGASEKDVPSRPQAVDAKAAAGVARPSSGGGGGGQWLPPPPPPGPRPLSRAWHGVAVAVALSASLGGGLYYIRKVLDDSKTLIPENTAELEQLEPPVPARGSAFPAHVQYLVVGGGTAAFACMRAIRSARPDARVLLVSEERALPYMRPPLSKELWREPDLATRADQPDSLTFRQWNGRRRPVVYEPEAFYTPVETISTREHGGAAVARGWTVTKLDVAAHLAELQAPGCEPISLAYDKVLVATGVRARRVPALAGAAARGRSLALRSLRDAGRLARALDAPAVRCVAVLGGGFLASELSAALADRLLPAGRRVVQLMSEDAPMAGVLPDYLAQDAGRRLREAGVELMTGEELAAVHVPTGDDPVRLHLASGATLDADLIVECVGSEMDTSLAEASALETHPELGGLLVNAELQARADVYVAGDAACFYDVVLGRRRVEHHDHAVVSGRLAGENMAAASPPKHYTHQSMFWSDLGPQLGYEAIGIIDSRLPTVGIFSADAVTDVSKTREAVAGEGAAEGEGGANAEGAASSTAADKKYERGVVFYLRGRRVVGVLLWNLFNRMHVARQVLAQGEFEDLFEVGKLFSPHEED